MAVSIIIPTYNERKNIVKLVNEIESVFTLNKIKGEIIIVDDNSPDGTGKIAERLAKSYNNIKVVHRKQKLGLYTAIRDGCEIASYDSIITMDSDFSHPSNIIPRLLSKKDDADIVVASRFVDGGGMRAPFFRVIFSKMINLIVRILLRVEIKDCTGGFQLLDKNLFKKLDVNGYGGEYDIELLVKARRSGYRVVEIPFVYTFRELDDSKTNIIKHGYRYLTTGFRLFFKH